MKRTVALILALVMVLSLTACIGTGSATKDQAKKLSSYSKDFKGLKQYLYDKNGLSAFVDSKTGEDAAVNEIYYDMVGAKDGVRYLLTVNNPMPYIEIYDFSSAATADSASPKAKAILASIKKTGKFTPLEDGTEMTAVITKSGKYVIAWDATRKFNYDSVATKTVINNW